MGPFQLDFEVPISKQKIVHGKEILFLGSCFSDEIADKAKFVGLNVSSNPLGTIFHPLVLSRFIQETVGNISTEERIINRNDLYFSWDASSTIYASSKNDLTEKLNTIRKNWLDKFKSADFLFITFGTAWGYKYTTSNEYVANCLKSPKEHFIKELSDQKLIVEEWERCLEILKKINPDLKIVFTVSPVRHSKDGLIENNWSKAILIDAVRKLTEKTNSSYFPSYEIIIDELRDYRFYKSDRVHPSEEAINYVWSVFSKVFFTSETLELNREVEKLRLSEAHKPLFPESNEFRNHKLSTNDKRANLIERYPFLCLD